MPSIVQLSIVILHIKLNADYIKLLRLPSPLMSLMPYIKDLEWDLWEESIEGLHRKEKDIVDFLVNTSLPCAWPLSGTEYKCYNFSFVTYYFSFLELNSHSHIFHLFYFTHNDDQICVPEWFFTNKYIGNLCYFMEMCFAIFKLHSFLPMPNLHKIDNLRKSVDCTGIQGME